MFRKPCTAWIILPLIFILSCSGKQNDSIAIDNIPLTLTVRRFDQAQRNAAMDAASQPAQADTLIYQKDLRPFRDFVVEWQYAGLDSLVSDSLAAADLVGFFLRDSSVRALLDSVNKYYPSNFDFNALLGPGFKRMKHYFPQAEIPEMVTYVSGYQPSAATGTDELYLSKKYLGIGLHFFLGAGFPWYPSDLPVYIRQRFSPEYMPVMVMGKFADQILPKPKPFEQAPLLHDMIREGIRLYFLEKTLPDIPDSTRLFYTAQQMEWANYFEGMIYRNILPNLYKKEFQVHADYLGENPYTPGLALESAPRIGAYCGWKIVQAYMNKHSEKTLSELMQNPDPEGILRESGYNPKVYN